MTEHEGTFNNSLEARTSSISAQVSMVLEGCRTEAHKRRFLKQAVRGQACPSGSMQRALGPPDTSYDAFVYNLVGGVTARPTETAIET